MPDDLLSKIPAFPNDAKLATRKAGSEALQPLAQAMPSLISGSADLHGSTLNYIKDGGDFTRTNPSGRNIHFGIREHGMCAIMNGVSYHGIFRASGATFLVFTDYCRASIRLAALSKLPNIYIFTHDSIGVGEDGPTHEPVETVASVRVMPQIDVIRPADPEETAGAFVAAAERTDGPTLLALTRQTVPILNEIDVKLRREGVLRGGYIAKKETGKLDLILLSCGSELQHALAAAKELGEGTRVVSMPCFERFERQPESYRAEVLPNECRRRVAIEAGIPEIWSQYVGLDGKIVGLKRFGLKRAGQRSDERTRDRRPARDRRGAFALREPAARFRHPELCGWNPLASISLCWLSFQLSFKVINEPSDPCSSSTGSASGSAIPNPASDGPMARNMTFLGSLPPMMKPPMST